MPTLSQQIYFPSRFLHISIDDGAVTLILNFILKNITKSRIVLSLVFLGAFGLRFVLYALEQGSISISIDKVKQTNKYMNKSRTFFIFVKEN